MSWPHQPQTEENREPPGPRPAGRTVWEAGALGGSAAGVQTVPACGQDWPAGSWFTPRSFSSGFDEQCSEKWRGIQRLSPDSKSMPAVPCLLGLRLSFRKLQRHASSHGRFPREHDPVPSRRAGPEPGRGKRLDPNRRAACPCAQRPLVANWEGGSEGLHASPSAAAGRRRRHRLSAPTTRRPAPAHPGRRRPEATSAPGLGSRSLQASPGLSSSPGGAKAPGSGEFAQLQT